ncbi:probable basic-leucine zipper transcription factor P [Condylostylus longicornis]|uniref:probable basic-leucine zipper transcription factor P n=1 Tax=Condylostylus longicornis TaxID=2530218 RepID=UPI00244E1C07|nr:probable basic-leucine zipper transcription factor P [Condylostylus longicornis]
MQQKANMYKNFKIANLHVTDVDLEIMAATGRSPSSDSGVGLAVSDIRNRPACPLPYRPLSAGPILHRHHYHHHSSLRHLGGSQNRLAPTKTVGTNTPTKQGSLGANNNNNNNNNNSNIEGNGGGGYNQQQQQQQQQLQLQHNLQRSDIIGEKQDDSSNDRKEYNCDDTRSRRGSETQLPRSEYEHETVSVIL